MIGGVTPDKRNSAGNWRLSNAAVTLEGRHGENTGTLVFMGDLNKLLPSPGFVVVFLLT